MSKENNSGPFSEEFVAKLKSGEIQMPESVGIGGTLADAIKRHKEMLAKGENPIGLMELALQLEKEEDEPQA